MRFRGEEGGRGREGVVVLIKLPCCSMSSSATAMAFVGFHEVEAEGEGVVEALC